MVGRPLAHDRFSHCWRMVPVRLRLGNGSILVMTDHELLNLTATALYGALWQNALARALDINERTVRRWASGDAPVPIGVWHDISEIIADRVTELRDLRKTLPQH